MQYNIWIVSSIDIHHQGHVRYWKRQNRGSEIRKIYAEALELNLLWRKEILEFNELQFTIDSQHPDNDLFWDMTEIDKEKRMSKALTITNCSIQKLPRRFSVPFKIDRLDLSGNSISQIPLYWWQNYFSDLKVLRLAGNLISRLDWNLLIKLPQLKILDLQDNPLDEKWKAKFNAFRRITLWEIEKILF